MTRIEYGGIGQADLHWHNFEITPHAGQREHGPHWAGKPASMRSTRQAQAPQPVPAKVNSAISSEVVALAEFIAILMVEAEMPRHVQITGSDSCPCFSSFNVVVFNSTNPMDHFHQELKLLLRLVLILFGEPASFISAQLFTRGQLRMKNFQALTLLSFVKGIGSLSFVGMDWVFFVEISGVRLGRGKYHEQTFLPESIQQMVVFLVCRLCHLFRFLGRIGAVEAQAARSGHEFWGLCGG